MKNSNFSRFTAMIVCLLILTLNYSCSIDPDNELPDTEIKAVNATYYEGICSTDCFPSGGPYVIKDGATTVNAGINSKEMSYAAYNTETKFVVEATYYVTEGNSKVDARISIDINGNEVIFDKVASGSTVSHFVYLDTYWRACDQMNYSIKQVALGNPVTFEGTYELVPECISTEPLQVGDEAKGGIVAYLLQPGDPNYDPDIQHGLIVPSSDQSYGIPWYNDTYISTGATATTLGTGQSNTTSIVNEQGLGSYAAQLCDDLVYNSYTDWYLPSRQELEKILRNQYAIGGFQLSRYYWTSSELDDNKATGLKFELGFILNMNVDKSQLLQVRAVRSF